MFHDPALGWKFRRVPQSLLCVTKFGRVIHNNAFDFKPSRFYCNPLMGYNPVCVPQPTSWLHNLSVCSATPECVEKPCSTHNIFQNLTMVYSRVSTSSSMCSAALSRSYYQHLKGPYLSLWSGSGSGSYHSLFSRFWPSNAPTWPSLGFRLSLWCGPGSGLCFSLLCGSVPDPVFHFDAEPDQDPDPTSQNDADPCGSGSTTLSRISASTPHECCINSLHRVTPSIYVVPSPSL